MPKKRYKKAEIIKMEGLSQDTIKEFAPKDNSAEEDKLWEEYFRGSPKVVGFPSKQTTASLPFQGNEGDMEHSTAVSDATAVTTVIDGAEVTKEELLTLDNTHTKSEQIVYSMMYRETILKGKNEEYFSLRKLMTKTGIGSDKTVFNALKGLRNKLSIKMVEHSNNKPIGTLYRVFRPKEIFKLRSAGGMIIDINTKRIVTTAATGMIAATAVAYARKNASVDKERSYSKEKNRKQRDDNDRVFDHKTSTISLYEKYTGNQWRVGDDEFYQVVKDILLEVIEAAIISSILRSKAKMNSFAYCEGVINEFKDNLTLGYLGYLRVKWKEMLEQGPERKETTKASSKEHSNR